jgi:hypothetical protein
MSLIRRATQRAASIGAAIASVFLLATCDLDKILNVDTTKVGSGITAKDVSLSDTVVVLADTITMYLKSAIDLTATTTHWTSSDTTKIKIDSLDGVAIGRAVGTATITGRLLAPELGAGVVKSQLVRVRYKSLGFVTPAATDSIQGLGQTRVVSIRGTNFANALGTVALTADSFKVRRAGVVDTTLLRLTGTTLTAKKNGTSYLVAYYSGLIDSVAVRVRQVAKKISFPGPDSLNYTARHINFNLSVPLTVKDVADSVIPTPTLTWRTKDTTKATVVPATGVLKVKAAGITDSVWAKMDTVERGQKIVVSQVVASLTKTLGDARSDTVAKAVTVAPTVVARDSGSTIVAGATVIFRPGVGLNAAVTDTLQVTDVNGSAKPTAWKLGDVAGATNTLVATSGALATTTFTVTGIAGAPKKLAFTVQPTNAAVGAVIAPAVKVSISDSLGNPLTTATNSVTLAIGSNPGTATLGGTLTVAAVAGVATFSNLTLSASGSGYTLQASSGTLTSAVSNSFDEFGAATKVAFITQPSNVTTGAVMSPAVRVAVQDASGSTVTTATNTVTLSISTNPGAAILGGIVSAAAVAGIATFSNLTLSQLGTGYVLAAAATLLTTGNSSTFNVTSVGPATKLAFAVQPSNVLAGASIAPAIQVTVQDASGVTVISSTALITLAIDPTANPGSSTITGGSTLTAFASAGVATFSTATLNKVGTGYKLTASATALTGATSSTFNVTPGTATKLAFVQQPSHTVFSQSMAPAPTVAVQDANGNTVTTQAPTSIALTLTTCTATLLGTTSASTASGVASFGTLSIATQVSNCTLAAASTGLTSATSTAFNIVAASGGAVKLGFVTNPPTNTTAGSSLGTIQVALQDAAGATVTTGSAVTVTLALGANPGSGSLTGTLTASAISGIATFTGNTLAAAATGYTLTATATGYQTGTGSAFNITAGTASKVGFIQQPTTTTAGLPFSPTITVAVQDALGNTVTTSSASVTLQFSGAGTFGGSFDGASSVVVPAVNGVATYTGLKVKKANTGYLLLAFTGFLTSATSNSFNIDKAPVSLLSFSTQPSSSITAGTAFSVTVQTQDSVGNLYTDPAAAVTLSLTGGTAGAALSGTKTVSPVSGVAAFTNLSVDKSGTLYQLNASASGFPTNLSTTFAIVAGTAAKLGWLDQPGATFVNAPLVISGQLPRIAVQDALGNTVTSNNFTTVRLAVGVGPDPSFKSIGSSVTTFDMSTTNGVVTIPSTVAMSTTGSYTMAATAPFTSFPTLTASSSASFTVAAFDVKSKLGFVQGPSSATYGVVFSPAVVAAVQDQWGNTVTTATDAVSIVLGTDANPTTTLSGGAATAAVAGVATYSGVSLNKTGTGYTVVASATGLTSGTSPSFTVTSPGVVVISGTFLNDMVRLGNTIYFTHSNTLKSVSVRGGTVTTITASTGASRIATDGTNIFWAETGTLNSGDAFIKKLTVSSGTVSTLTTALTSLQAGTSYSKIYSDGANVYFIARNAAATALAVRSVSVSAVSAAPTDLVSTSNTSQIPYFAVGGGFIYFAAPASSTVQRIPTSGGVGSVLNTGTASPDFLALDGTTLYWNEGVNIRRIPSANTTGPVAPVTVINGPSSPYDLAIDGANLYVQYLSTVRRYSLADFSSFASPATTADQFNHSLLFDGTDIYFNDSIGRILKLPK